MCKTSRALEKDGLANAPIQSLAALGTGGKFPNNEERDLQSWVQGAFGVHLLPWSVFLDAEHGEEVDPIPVKLSCVFLHEYLHSLWEAGPARFKLGVMGPHDCKSLKQFWDHMQSLEGWESFRAVKDCSKLIPVLFHFDGAQVHQGKEWHVWSWRTPLTVGTAVADCKHVYCAYPADFAHSKVFKDKMHQAVARVLSWDLGIAETGVFPSLNMWGLPWLEKHRLERAGKLIAGGFTAALWGVNADHKAKKEMHMFKRHHECTLVCHQCMAQKPGHEPGLSFWELGEAALWRSTYIDHRAYCATEGLSPWLQIKHFTIDMVFTDLMHTVHLGFARDLLACAIRSWADAKLLPAASSTAKSLRMFWKMFCHWCRLNGKARPRGRLTPNNLSFGKQEYPELSSSCKAVTVSHMLRFCTAFALAKTRDNPELRDVKVALWTLNKALELWSSSALLLTEQVADKCFSLGNLFLDTYVSLAVQAKAQDKLRWKVRPKHHYFVHLLEFQKRTRLNPCYACSAFDDESFLGQFKRVGRMTRGSSNLCPRTLQRHIMGLKLRWNGK